jgi:hypothetical protein
VATNPALLTFTERIALTTAWGRYLTEIEQQAMDAALVLFPRPSDALEVGCQGGRWSRLPGAYSYRQVYFGTAR